MSVGRQALLVLAHLRPGHTCAQLASGFEVATTGDRYIAEAIDALAPTLRRSDETRLHQGIRDLDGTLLPIDRTAATEG